MSGITVKSGPVKSLAQLKIDAKNNGWPWSLDHPNDERALLNGCYPHYPSSQRVYDFYLKLLTVPRSYQDLEEELAQGKKVDRRVKPFKLLDWWYTRIIGPLFGWKRKDGRRRFEKAFVTTAKKSGKSSVLSGLPLYMMLADGEEEAECYSAATDRDQASIIFTKTARMTNASKHLKPILKVTQSKKKIEHLPSGSWYEAISSDADSAEGKNPHLILADELHVWKDRQFFNSLMYGGIARAQSLFLMITTAGEDPETIAYEEYEFAKDLLDPNTDFYSENHFACICESTKEWDDPEGWGEANPSILEGIGSVEMLQTKCDEAKKSPRKKREFIRYITNKWVTGAEDAWLSYESWVQCKVPSINIKQADPATSYPGDECWGAIDLSSSRDLTSLCLAFLEEKRIKLKWWFWCPAEGLKDREEQWRVPLRDWVQSGYVITTPGSVVDYAYIRMMLTGTVLNEDGTKADEDWPGCLTNKYVIRQVGYDRWNASKLVSELYDYDGLEMVEFAQTYKGLSEPSKELDRRILSREVEFEHNPVMDWMVRGTVIDTDPAGNIKPTKSKSKGKIDGVVTAIMATDLCIKSNIGTFDIGDSVSI